MEHCLCYLAHLISALAKFCFGMVPRKSSSPAPPLSGQFIHHLQSQSNHDALKSRVYLVVSYLWSKSCDPHREAWGTELWLPTYLVSQFCSTRAGVVLVARGGSEWSKTMLGETTVQITSCFCLLYPHKQHPESPSPQRLLREKVEVNSQALLVPLWSCDLNLGPELSVCIPSI